MSVENVKFSFYGFGVSVSSGDAVTLDHIKRDFSYFVSPDVLPEIFVEVFCEAPDYARLPAIPAAVYSPRNITYKDRERSYIDYFGRALTVIDEPAGIYKIFCSDADLRHEIVFLTLLALAGQSLDAKHIHRVHGLGVEIKGKAVLVLLPSGGGKTTLLLELLKDKSVKLISEDSPLIDRTGKILPFLLRIGVTYDRKPEAVPDRYVRLIKRMEFGPKYLIDTDYFAGQLTRSPAEPFVVLCGVRNLGDASGIRPLSKMASLKEFVKNCVVGVGLYQGVEFVLQEGCWGLFKKTGLALSRLRNSWAVISRSKTFEFTLGSDRAKNVRTLLEFLNSQTTS